MKTKKLKDLKKGDFFRLSNSETAPVWVRGDYVRETKRYSCTMFDDTNHERTFKGLHLVFVDFEF